MYAFRLLIVLIFATRSRLLKLFCVALETPKQPPRLKADRLDGLLSLIDR